HGRRIRTRPRAGPAETGGSSDQLRSPRHRRRTALEDQCSHPWIVRRTGPRHTARLGECLRTAVEKDGEKDRSENLPGCRARLREPEQQGRLSPAGRAGCVEQDGDVPECESEELVCYTGCGRRSTPAMRRWSSP